MPCSPYQQLRRNVVFTVPTFVNPDSNVEGSSYVQSFAFQTALAALNLAEGVQ